MYSSPNSLFQLLCDSLWLLKQIAMNACPIFINVSFPLGCSGGFEHPCLDHLQVKCTTTAIMRISTGYNMCCRSCDRRITVASRNIAVVVHLTWRWSRQGSNPPEHPNGKLTLIKIGQAFIAICEATANHTGAEKRIRWWIHVSFYLRPWISWLAWN